MQYDIQEHLEKVYATFPEAKRKPIIGITTNYMNGGSGWWRSNVGSSYC